MTQHPYQPTQWIWQKTGWPSFTFDASRVAPMLREARLKQGELLGKAGAVGEDDVRTAVDTLVQNIVTSSAIEGEQLNVNSVRSSLARRLGIREEHPYPVSDRSEGLASIMLDAIDNLATPLTKARLIQWHTWLFPDNEESLRPVLTGQLRGKEPMQVVSGRIERPVVHFEAPPRAVLDRELERFLDWFNQSQRDPQLDPLVRAGIAHFWFVTLHPFDDGNGRLTRAVTDLALAQGENRSVRLYAMAATILERRKGYYEILERSQRGDVDITAWLEWFLDTLTDTFQASLDSIESTVAKSRFWQRHRETALMPEQKKVLNRLLDGDFEEGIKASQYAAVAKVSKPTATRQLGNLLDKGCLVKRGAGKATRYSIAAGDLPEPNSQS